MNRRTALLPAALTALVVVAASSACTVHIDTGQHEATGDEVSEVREVTAVTRVELRTSGTLNLAVGDEVALSVTGKEDILEDLETTVEGDTLVIDLPGSWRNPGFLEYNLVLPELSTVVLSGSGQVFGELGGTDVVVLEIDGSGDIGIDDVTASDVTLGIHGSGTIRAHQLSAQDTTVLVDGSGDVDVEGSSDRLAVSVPGSGDVEAAGLRAHVGEVSIDGSGEATVNVSDTLRAVIEGSGEITYLGDPTVDQDIDGSGEVQRG